MATYTIVTIVGSLRKDSFNRMLAGAIVKMAPSDFSFVQVQIGDLPLYNQDDDASPAESVKRLKREITASRDFCSSPPNTTARSPGYSKTRSTTPRALMARAPGRASPPA